MNEKYTINEFQCPQITRSDENHETLKSMKNK